MEKNGMSLQIINPNAAGIDVGSGIACGPRGPDCRKRTLCVYTKDLQQIIDYLRAHKITSATIESSGSY
ncbi:MAG: hypothetical protein K0R59_156 [Sphingobacterium sp.]|jgi:hypothetical protein|nr:hypothetical protein [Sphingobacterium sp.]